MTTVQQTLTMVQQQVTQVHNRGATVQHQVPLVQQQGTPVDHQGTLVRHKDTLVQESLSSAQDQKTSNKTPRTPAQQLVTSDKQPLNKLAFVQHPLPCGEQSLIPGTLVMQPMSPTQHYIASVKDPRASQHLVTSVKQPLTPVTVIQKPFNEAQHPLTSIKHPGTSSQQLMTTVQQPVYASFNYYWVYATFPGIVFVSPQMSNLHLAVTSHLDMAEFQED